MSDNKSLVNDSGLVYSVVVTAAKVHDLASAADLLEGYEEVDCGDVGFQGIGKRPEMEGEKAGFRVATGSGKRYAMHKRGDFRVRLIL